MRSHFNSQVYNQPALTSRGAAALFLPVGPAPMLKRSGRNTRAQKNAGSPARVATPPDPPLRTAQLQTQRRGSTVAGAGDELTNEESILQPEKPGLPTSSQPPGTARSPGEGGGTLTPTISRGNSAAALPATSRVNGRHYYTSFPPLLVGKRTRLP